MQKHSKIYIAGHTGLVGSAILRKLQNEGYDNLVLKTHDELDLTNQKAVSEFFEQEKPEYVFFCAAKAGGVLEQLEKRADFLYINITMQTIIMHEAYKHKAKLLYLSSLCIYPKDATLPIKEESMLCGELQFNNEPYAVAKIAGTKACEFYNAQFNTNFIALVPTSIYGINDNFNPKTTHVFPAIFTKIYLAKLFNENAEKDLLSHLKCANLEQVKTYLNELGITPNSLSLFGTGKPKREFIYVDDVANACVFVMKNINASDLKKINKDYHNTHLNLAHDEVYSVADIAYKIKEILGYKGEILFDPTKPDGTMLKSTDTSRLQSFGFRPQISLEEGITKMYEWYKISYRGGGALRYKFALFPLLNTSIFVGLCFICFLSKIKESR